MKKRQIIILGGVGSVITGGFFAVVFWIINIGINPFWVGFSIILGIGLVIFGGILISIGTSMPLVELDMMELRDAFISAEIPKEEAAKLINNLEFIIKNYKIRTPEVQLIIQGVMSNSELRKQFLEDYKGLFLEKRE